jgi:hypothetical protein
MSVVPTVKIAPGAAFGMPTRMYTSTDGYGGTGNEKLCVFTSYTRDSDCVSSSFGGTQLPHDKVAPLPSTKIIELGFTKNMSTYVTAHSIPSMHALVVMHMLISLHSQ